MLHNEGIGWRISKDPSRKTFPVLIAGDGWAIELTDKEFSELVQLVGELLNQISQIEDHLMPEEIIFIEMEQDSWWGCIEGKSSKWNMRFVLEQFDEVARGVEVSWQFPAAKAIALAMRTMWDSC